MRQKRQDMGTIIEHARQNTASILQSTPMLISPVPRLISCNDPPSQEEAASIHEAISIIQSNLAKLRQEEFYDGESSSPPNTALSPNALEHFIHIHQSLFSVKRRFPLELWALVFNNTLAVEYAPRSRDIAQATTLSSVSRLWRSIALSDPCLWEKLPTFFISRHKTRTTAYVDYTRTIIERGAVTPLSFHISAPFEEIKSHPLIDLLVAHSRRWGHIILESTAMTVQGLNVSGSLPNLHTLKLQIDNLNPLPRTITVFREAPALCNVSVHGLWPVSIELPWSQLEEYRENAANTVGLIEVIQHSTKLRRLSYVTHVFPHSVQDLPHVVLANLTSLRLHHKQDVGSFGPLIENITLPVLEDIQIYDLSGDLVDQLTSLIRRSNCDLRRLAFSTNPPTAHAGRLTELLLLTPSLEALDVDDMPTQDLDNLTQLPIVPCLRSLTVRFERSRRTPLIVDPQRFNALAESRCSLERLSFNEGGCLRLQEFILVFQTVQDCLSSHAALERWDVVRRSQTEWKILEDYTKKLEMATKPQPVLRPPHSRVVVHNGMDAAYLQNTLRKLGELPEMDSRVLLHSNVIFYVQMIERIIDRIPPAIQQKVSEAIISLDHRWRARAAKDDLKLNWRRRGAVLLAYHPLDPKENADVFKSLYTEELDGRKHIWVY